MMGRATRGRGPASLSLHEINPFAAIFGVVRSPVFNALDVLSDALFDGPSAVVNAVAQNDRGQLIHRKAQRMAVRVNDAAGLTDRMAFLIGVGPIASVRSAVWMNENLFGVTVPDSIIKRLEGAADQKAEGRRICVEIIQQLQEVPGVAGVHIMAPNQDMEGIAAVISDSGVRAGR